jgi:TPR repeat protein
MNAAKQFKLAADQNDAARQDNYGFCLRAGMGVDVDLIGAAQYVKMAADQQRPHAQYEYGHCLEEGRGVARDLVGAIKYYKLAADQQHTTAQVVYGVRVGRGVGVAPNPRLAAECYEKAATLGDELGLILFGQCMEFGESVPRDLQRACACYESAALQGDEIGQFSFGFCLRHGLGIEVDMAESTKYYEKSIENCDGPDPWAVFAYAQCLQYGNGFDENLDAASDFYEIVVPSPGSRIYVHSFRCLRALSKATFRRAPVRPSKDQEVVNVEFCNTIRPLKARQPTSDYLVPPIGPCENREIGRGGSSEVKVVRSPDTGKMIAVKYFSGPNMDTMRFSREVEALAKLYHPCVLQIINWAFPEGLQCGEIHTEIAERGSLENLLKERKTESGKRFWSPTRIAIAICDMVLGMRFVHWNGIVHRDLKPSNILLRANGRALIGDFGSIRFESDDGTPTGESGTVHYAAPELFQESAALSGKVDVFAFGLILYEIVSGFPVFPRSLQPFEVIRKIRRGYRPAISDECGDYMAGLIRRCWSDDPSSRPSFDEILADFQAHDFKILRDVQWEEIRDAVDRVLRWEFDARVSHH